MKFAAYMAVWFITFFHILLVLFYIIVYMLVCFVCFCLIFKLCTLVMYFFVMFTYSYCYVWSVLGILFHCAVLCIVCV